MASKPVLTVSAAGMHWAHACNVIFHTQLDSSQLLHTACRADYMRFQPFEHLLPVQHLWLGASTALGLAQHGSTLLACTCRCCLLVRC